MDCDYKNAPEAARLEKLNEILARVDSLPRLDGRSEDEILGYDEHGLPR